MTMTSPSPRFGVDEHPRLRTLTLTKRTAVEIAAAAKLEAVVREKLAPHRSALLADLQKLVRSSARNTERLSHTEHTLHDCMHVCNLLRPHTARTQAATGTFKKAHKVLFEIQPDGLQHPGFPVVAFLETEDGDEIPNDVDLLEGIPTLLPEEELRRAYPEKVDMEGESGEGSFEVQSKALAVWLADCYKELVRRWPCVVIRLGISVDVISGEA